MIMFGKYFLFVYIKCSMQLRMEVLLCFFDLFSFLVSKNFFFVFFCFVVDIMQRTMFLYVQLLCDMNIKNNLNLMCVQISCLIIRKLGVWGNMRKRLLIDNEIERNYFFQFLLKVSHFYFFHRLRINDKNIKEINDQLK